MKLHYITPFALALSLMTGCIEIKVEKGDCCKAKCCGKEDKEDHDSKCDRKEKQECEDKDDAKCEDKDSAKPEDKDDAKSEHKEKKEKKEHKSKAKLQAEAKISEADARQTALAKVANGSIKESELEKEDGHLQWSFDVTTPDSKDITEVNVDAITGTVISVGKEAPEGDKPDKKDKDKDEDKD